MRALTWHGKRDVRVDSVPDPKIEDPTDVIVRITSTGICGSDLHLYEVLLGLGPIGDMAAGSHCTRARARSSASTSSPNASPAPATAASTPSICGGGSAITPPHRTVGLHGVRAGPPSQPG